MPGLLSPRKRRDPAEPDRRVSPYSLLGRARGGRGVGCGSRPHGINFQAELVEIGANLA